MALTTVRPSPGLPMFKSDNNISNVSDVIFCSASATLAAVVTAKPCLLKDRGQGHANDRFIVHKQ
jgi:hypothetical protein